MSGGQAGGGLGRRRRDGSCVDEAAGPQSGAGGIDTEKPEA